jgi:acylphosphatase
MSTAHLIVKGRVQGVFYRYSTRERASDLGLNGWVRNLADGNVELQASGPRKDIETLILWCYEGPANAVVSDVVVKWLDNEAEDQLVKGFHIK